MTNKISKNPINQFKFKMKKNKNWLKSKKGFKQNSSFNTLNKARLQMFSGKRGK